MYRQDIPCDCINTHVTVPSIHPLSYLGRLNITEVYLAGVDAALKKHALGDAKGIKAHFNMDESGILNITNVNISYCCCIFT